MKEWYGRTQGESASNRPESARLSFGMILARFSRTWVSERHRERAYRRSSLGKRLRASYVSVEPLLIGLVEVGEF